MFTIIGGDGREYGPASAEQIRTWIASGRANLETKAKALGSDEWRRLGDFAEFAATTTPPPAPPATFPSAAAPATAPSAVAPVTPIDPNLADRGARLLAVIVDIIVGFLAVVPGGVLLFSIIVQAALHGGDVENVEFGMRGVVGVIFLVLGLIALLAVQIWMLSTRGQTIGKRLLSVRIVKFADNANPGFVGAVLMRAIVPALIGAVPFVGFIFTIVDICFIFRDDRRCLHDLLAGTKVVRA